LGWKASCKLNLLAKYIFVFSNISYLTKPLIPFSPSCKLAFKVQQNYADFNVGPSGVLALHLAAGINKGGRYFGPSVVRALPLAAGINEGGHYFLGIFPPFLTTAIQNHRRGCCRVSNFCMGP
jgi:hypothetical protein